MPPDPSFDEERNSPHESDSQAFIVRIWVEEIDRVAGQTVWRGHITHVPSGERRYIKSLGDIEMFIAGYLERLDVKLRWSWRMWRWLRQWQCR